MNNTVRSPAPGAMLFNLPGTKKNNSVNKVMNAANIMANNAMNTASNTVANIMNTTPKEGVNIVYVLLFVFVLVILTVIGIFWKDISHSLKIVYESLRQMLGAPKVPIVTHNPEENVTDKPEAPQEPKHHEKGLVEKILPGHQEVFNISKNSYTYYDAEPLCKALNAELATYEQVKNAYSKGADWCNYGWVKGQMAVYPTQQSTWDDLQKGPEEQRLSCGHPGLNGGFFDNPELRFGVNCYGVKPDQKAHDATDVSAGDGAPLSPGGHELEQKIAKFRSEANYISILPFSKSGWSS
jgi:hypothetical protein